MLYMFRARTMVLCRSLEDGASGTITSMTDQRRCFIEIGGERTGERTNGRVVDESEDEEERSNSP
jgi:hypothetical protein